MKAKHLLVTLFFTSLATLAADKAGSEMDPKMAAMMKAFETYSKPGAPHKVLEGMAGDWTYASKFWEGSQAKVQESSGTSTFRMILGGRWLQQEIKGEAMGMPFEGVGMTGYDNLKGKYESLWFDNMGTGVTHGTGTFDAKTKTLKDGGIASCPMTPSKTREYRGEWKIVNSNKMVYSMFGPDLESGKEFKQMEMTFTRIKR